MSAAKPGDPTDYTNELDRFINFAEDFLGTTLGDTQKRILREVVRNQYVLIVSGNGVGKSYAVAILILAFLYTNVESTVLGTSGSYSQFVDTMWRPMRNMWKTLKHERGLPGRKLEGTPTIEVDGDWYAKVVSPRDPGDLEGRHAADIMVVIEEADKEYITEKHFDSAGSSVTDASDRMVAIANPPADENNVVYQKMRSDRWTTIQFSSFESHNVQVDADLLDADLIPGLVGLPTLADDWEEWNDEPWPKAPVRAREVFDTEEYPGASTIKEWFDQDEIARETALQVFRPGFEQARFAHEERADLDERWYRRRAGEIPPDTASVHRPFGIADVERALEAPVTKRPLVGIGYDVARMGGDWNVICGYDGETVRVLERWKGVDHNQNYDRARGWMRPHRDAQIAVDAQGEGSGIADQLYREFGDRMTRFNAGEEAAEGSKFYSRWGEGLYHLGQFLQSGGSVSGEKMDEELKAAAREVRFQEKHYASRDADVLKATKKSEVEERLDRSPDVLDAAYMAVWAQDAESDSINQLTW